MRENSFDCEETGGEISAAQAPDASPAPQPLNGTYR
jgi:hypothetical protein